MRLEIEIGEIEISDATWREHLESLGFLDEGWITETGKYWPCDEHFLHGEIAKSILGGLSETGAEIEADRRGWLRLSDYGNRTAAKRLNQKQLDTLFDWCEFHGLDFKQILATVQFV
jgi:hypothetical protein